MQQLGDVAFLLPSRRQLELFLEAQARGQESVARLNRQARARN